MSGKIISLIIVILIALGATVYGVMYFQPKDTAELPEQPINSNLPTNSVEPVVGGDKDEHGCIGSAGYSWCRPLDKCIRIWEEDCYATAEDGIKDAFAQKYNKPVADFNINISQQQVGYAVGGVKIGTNDPAAEGGLFLAVEQGASWIIVFDGNGAVPCQQIETDYEFPKALLTNICD